MKYLLSFFFLFVSMVCISQIPSRSGTITVKFHPLPIDTTITVAKDTLSKHVGALGYLAGKGLYVKTPNKYQPIGLPDTNLVIVYDDPIDNYSSFHHSLIYWGYSDTVCKHIWVYTTVEIIHQLNDLGNQIVCLKCLKIQKQKTSERFGFYGKSSPFRLGFGGASSPEKQQKQ